MSELEEKLGAMLSNPQLMQQISSLVQAMGQPSQPAPSPPPMPEPPPKPPELDFSQLQGLASLLQGNRIDTNQQALLRALSPYLSPWRVGKLERASKMAGLASVFLRGDGQSPGGR